MNTADALPLPEAEPRKVFGLFERESRLSFIALCLALWSILSYLLITHFIVMSVEIKGISMIPTLRDGQHFVLYRFPYLWRAPRANEIVVIRDPQDNDLSIKRIIAGPHDKIAITEAGGVFVNGEKLSEPYLSPYARAATSHKVVKETVLGPDDFFVLGDNRDFSVDSRTYGMVPRDHILGCIHRPANRL